jgi:hypothetical protein
MSSTNRSGERLPNDSYPTPDELALACVQTLANTTFLRKPPVQILEPSVGTGPFVRACHRVWPGSHVFGVDIVESRYVGYIGQFENFLSVGGWDLIIGNPPFSLAEAHIRHAMDLLTPTGVLALVLSVNFLGSLRRTDLFREHPIQTVNVIRPRPRFAKDSTDSVEYALMVWGGPPLGVRHIDWEKPRAERKGRSARRKEAV